MSVIKAVPRISNTVGRFFVIALLLCIVAASMVVSTVGAAPYAKLSTRSLRIGTTVPGETTDYLIRLSWPTNTSIGSIRFLLCEDYLVEEPCASTPAGDMSGAVLASQTGSLGNFSISSAATNEIVVSRGGFGAGMTGTGMHSFDFDDIVNPTGLHHRFYIQIFTYSNTTATGTPTHMSSVASATAEPIVINGDVPPILYFCAALTITDWCESSSGNYVDYGYLDPVNGHSTSSQFGVATNAQGGYIVTVNGDTMTSGNKTIAALPAPDAYTTGVPQFGINLRANTTPSLGQDPTGDGISVVASDYDNPDLFKYEDGDMVAGSVTGTTFNTFTVTYILNVPPDQPSGIYNTTIAYICTAAF